jgi:hypothetical protein
MEILLKESGVLLKKQREDSGGSNQTTPERTAKSRDV